MSEATGPSDFGRVDEDGTVYVRTGTGERMVGQVPDASAEEALSFYVRRFESLEIEVNLLQTRLSAGALSPEESRKRIAALKESVVNANAVGDLDGLAARLDELVPLVDQHAEQRKAARAQQAVQTRESKEAMVAEAEKLAQSNDWRNGVQRFRDLLEQWKALPRIDRSTDDELWHRFSSARTTYTRRRKAQFAEQAHRREEAKAEKERIIAEARSLVDSTDWGPTARSFAQLMSQWRAAGRAPRDVDDTLWATFRGLQDQFFNARTAAQAEQDAEFTDNLQSKEALLDEYEPRIRPDEDLAQAKAVYRELLDKFGEIGKVPRDAMRPLQTRLKNIERAVKAAEDEQWRRTDPEARARAEDTAQKLRHQIEGLERQAAELEAAGNDRKAAELRASADTYRSWLEQAEKAVTDFGG